MRYDSVDDETRIDSQVLCNVGPVDWCTTEYKEHRVGRGGDRKLSAWGHSWRLLLVVLIAPCRRLN